MVNNLDEKQEKMGITEAERFSNWAKLKIKSITSPNELSEKEKGKFAIHKLTNEHRKVFTKYEIKKRV